MAGRVEGNQDTEGCGQEKEGKLFFQWECDSGGIVKLIRNKKRQNVDFCVSTWKSM